MKIDEKIHGSAIVCVTRKLMLCSFVCFAVCWSNAEPSFAETGGNTGRSNSSVLIAYFSRVGNTDFPYDMDAVTGASVNLRNGEYLGNTELIARWIQEKAGGELFLIQTAEAYPADYDETVNRGQKEKKEGARPALASHVKNMDDYDVIFLGFPNWWYDMPMAIYSFLEEYDLSGKTVIPFCTSGGSRFSGALDTIRDMEPGINLLKGLAVRDGEAPEAQASVAAWLREIDFVQ